MNAVLNTTQGVSNSPVAVPKAKASLVALDRKLRWHDWFYFKQDSRDAYLRGKAEEVKLQALASESPLHQQLYWAWESLHYGRTPDKVNLDSLALIRLNMGLGNHQCGYCAVGEQKPAKGGYIVKDRFVCARHVSRLR